MTDDLFAGEKYLRAMLDAFPVPVFLVDRSMVIRDANAAASGLLRKSDMLGPLRLCGDSLQCTNALAAPDGCGTSRYCPECALRQAVNSVFDGSGTYRRFARMVLEGDGSPRTYWFLVTGQPFTHLEDLLAVVTMEDLTELVELRMMIPLCTHCRKVRDDRNYWQRVEDYLSRHTGVEFSHGVCPDCIKKYYPEYADDLMDETGGGDS